MNKSAAGLAKHGNNWEDLAKMDPLWAILSDEQRRYGKWNEQEFFHTGQEAIAESFKVFDRLGYPRQKARALDFGCGVGRLTYALAKYFDEVCGVDISPTMLRQAEAHRGSRPHGERCTFKLNSTNDLAQFASDSFDLVYTTIVLQHLPKKSDIESYLREFMRIVKPGGLVCFQLPTAIPLRHRIQLRRRFYNWLTRLGVPGEWLYARLALHPIEIQCLSHARIRQALNVAGAKVLETFDNTAPGGRVPNFIYYVTKNPG